MAQITEDYVSYETAKLLKEKGFDGQCLSKYNSNGCIWDNIRYDGMLLGNNDIFPQEYLAPTLQMAMKWLREVHNYHICINLDSYVEPYDNLYYILIRRRKDKYENLSPCEQVYYESYEEAAEAAIKYCLENLI